MSNASNYAVNRQQEAEYRRLEEQRRQELERQRREAEERARQLAAEKQRLADLAKQREAAEAELQRQQQAARQQLAAIQANYDTETARINQQLQAQIAALSIATQRQEQTYQAAQSKLEALERQIAAIERMDTGTYAIFAALTQSFGAFAQLDVQAVEAEGEGFVIRFGADAQPDAYAQLAPQQDQRVALRLDLTEMYGPQGCEALIENIHTGMSDAGIEIQPAESLLDDSDKPNWERVRPPMRSRD
jgi:DNA repair exonuclease SbcCD ATPase subunit